MAPFIYVIASIRPLLAVWSTSSSSASKLEALAIAFGATAAITFCYGFLEHVGLPHINWWFVWPVMGASWILANMYAERRYR